MIAQVAIAIPVTKTFAYNVPETLEPFVDPYTRVVVPFHNRFVTGCVMGVEDGVSDKLKDICHAVDPLPMVGGFLEPLIQWTCRYYAASAGLTLKYALPSYPLVEKYLVVTSIVEKTVYLNGTPLKKAIAEIGREALFDLFRRGEILFTDIFTGKPLEPVEPLQPPQGEPEKTLLTAGIDNRMEYYIDHAERSINNGGNVLMLLPDYRGAGDYLNRALSERFPGQTFWYGSSVPPKRKMEAYFRAREGAGAIFMGNKAAVFIPVKNLSLIIVERGEEDEFRNEEAVKFNAPLVALKRAGIEGVPIIFGSASPPLEIFRMSRGRGWNRVGEKGIGPIAYNVFTYNVFLKDKISPARKALPKEFFSYVHSELKEGANTAIYTPRKDYGARVTCLECKAPLLCPSCGGTVSLRKVEKILSCSGCGGTTPYEGVCGQCKGNLITVSRIGAEFVEEALRAAVPGADIMKITGENIRKSLKLLKKTPKGSPRVLVGTHVLSKLYGIPVKTLFLLGWEEHLRISGFRAREKMFRTLINLMDALRPERTVFIMEKRYSVDVAAFMDTGAFYAGELRERKEADYPPFSRIFLIEIRRKDEEQGRKMAKRALFHLKGEIPHGQIMGPRVQKRSNSHVWKIIVKGDWRDIADKISSLSAFPGVRVIPDPPSI